MKVQRFDIAKISQVERTPQGFLRAPAHLTRTGVFKYRRADGSVFKELRLPEEVFNEASLKTLRGVPVTIEHPPEMLNADNVKKYMRGYTSDSTERDEDMVKTTMTITDAEAIQQVEAGKQQVSCGYLCELEMKPGVYDGEEYDAIQRGIVYNHVAVVDRGRAGPSVKIRLDSQDAVLDGPEFEACVEQVSKDPSVENAYAVCNATVGMKDQNNGGATMEKMMLGGKEYEVTPELKAALEAHMASMAAEMDAKMKSKDELFGSKEQELEKMKGEADALKGKCDSLEVELKKREDSAKEVPAEKIREAARERLSVLRVAEQSLTGEALEKLDSMEDMEIRKAVLTACQPELKLDGKSDQYVVAAFDIVSTKLKDSDEAHKRLGASLTTARKDGSEDPVEAARKRQNDETLKAWQKPLSAVK